MFEERMKTSAIPERIYALCVAVKNRGIQVKCWKFFVLDKKERKIW